MENENIIENVNRILDKIDVISHLVTTVCDPIYTEQAVFAADSNYLFSFKGCRCIKNYWITN